MAGDDFLDQLIAALPSSAAGSGSGSGPGPHPAQKKEVTYSDFEKVLDSTPLFMRETPKDAGESNGERDEAQQEVLEALKSLVFEGEGDDVAQNFKEHGNELHAQKSYPDAVDAYTSGLNANPSSASLRSALLNNRAACNLALKNYRAVLRDTGALIALYTARKESDKGLVKGMFRATQALIALERWKEAKDVIVRGKDVAEKVKEDLTVWSKAESEVERGWKRHAERVERIRREKLGKLALRKALDSRGLIIIDTPNPPDNPHPVSFDPDALPTPPPLAPPSMQSDEHTEEEIWTPPPPHAPLIFPVFLLYPAHSQSDFITHFNEDTSFDDQLQAIFPASSSSSASNGIPFAQWDSAREYYNSNLVIYVETLHRRLLKVGKNLTLREVVSKAKRDKMDDVEKDGVVLRDGLLSFIVLVKGTQEKAWIEEFKRKRDEK